MRPPSEGGRGEIMIRLGVHAAIRTGDEELRRQCVARLGVCWEPSSTEPIRDEELRRQCIARLGVCWSYPPSPPAKDPDAHQMDSLGLRPAGEGGWISEAHNSTVSSPVSSGSSGDAAQYRALASHLVGVGTWFDDGRRLAHEAEDADRRRRDMADENRRVREQLDAARKEALGWRRAAEGVSSKYEALKSQADEANESVRRCGELLEQGAEAERLQEEELERMQHDAKDALERAAEAEGKSLQLQGKVQLLTTRAGKAEATSAMLQERLHSTTASYEEKLAQACRDVDMRTEELNNMQDRLDEFMGEKKRVEKRAGE